MTDEEAAIAHVKKRYWDKKNVEPEILAMDIKCGVEDFLAGVEYARKDLADIQAARQKDADMAAHYYKKCQELQAFIDELVLKGVVK